MKILYTFVVKRANEVHWHKESPSPNILGFTFPPPFLAIRCWTTKVIKVFDMSMDFNENLNYRCKRPFNGTPTVGQVRRKKQPIRSRNRHVKARRETGIRDGTPEQK